MSGDLRTRVREFAEDVLAHAPVPDPDTVYDERHPVWKEFQSAGLANWWLPARVGGAGLDMTASVPLVADLAYRDAGFAFAAFLPVLGSRMAELYAAPGVADGYLEEMAATGSTCAALGSEAEAGSELTRTATTFRRDRDRVVLSGEKAFSTNLGAARFGVVLARDADDPRTFAAVLVPADTPGFTVGQRWRMSGLHGTGTYAASLDGVEVPATHVLDGGGIRVLEVGLNASRLLMSATAIGLVRRIRDLSTGYAAGKRVDGRPLDRHPVFASRMGQLEMELETMKSQCRVAAAAYDALYVGPSAPAAMLAHGVLKDAVVAKMHCGQAGWGIAARASESFGGLGYTEGHEIGKLVRDMRHVSIVEGGDDVLRELLHGRFVRRPSRRG